MSVFWYNCLLDGVVSCHFSSLSLDFVMRTSIEIQEPVEQASLLAWKNYE